MFSRYPAGCKRHLPGSGTPCPAPPAPSTRCQAPGAGTPRALTVRVALLADAVHPAVGVDAEEEAAVLAVQPLGVLEVPGGEGAAAAVVGQRRQRGDAPGRPRRHAPGPAGSPPARPASAPAAPVQPRLAPGAAQRRCRPAGAPSEAGRRARASPGLGPGPGPGPGRPAPGRAVAGPGGGRHGAGAGGLGGAGGSVAWQRAAQQSPGTGPPATQHVVCKAQTPRVHVLCLRLAPPGRTPGRMHSFVWRPHSAPSLSCPAALPLGTLSHLHGSTWATPTPTATPASSFH